MFPHRLTQDLLNFYINNFTKRARDAEEKFLIEKQQLVDDLASLFNDLNDTEAKFVEIARLLNAATRKNDMNKQYIGQTAVSG